MSMMKVERIALYEPDEDEPRDYAAIFSNGKEAWEVRCVEQNVWLWEADGLRYRDNLIVGNQNWARLSCMHGRELSYTRFDTSEQALAYFWTFVDDPESGIMEGKL